jgi:HD-GYP domain-containing protein (c-di-GMP phosphodiesterase class II)
MSSHRPYRPAKSKADVLAEISGGRGTKYDAAVVDIMLQVIEGEASACIAD